MKERVGTVEVFIQRPFNGLVYVNVTGCPDNCLGKRMETSPRRDCPLSGIKDRDVNPQRKGLAQRAKRSQCNGNA